MLQKAANGGLNLLENYNIFCIGKPYLPIFSPLIATATCKGDGGLKSIVLFTIFVQLENSCDSLLFF